MLGALTFLSAFAGGFLLSFGWRNHSLSYLAIGVALTFICAFLTGLRIGRDDFK